MSYSAPTLIATRQSIDTLTASWLMEGGAFSSIRTWPSANLAVYVPIHIPARVIVRKLWFASGSTGTGNVDIGLYDAGGAEVVAATNAAKGAADTEQVFDVTDTTVGPGLYYIGLSSDSATDTFYAIAPAAPQCAAMGVLTEATAYPLPSSATWAVNQTLAFAPYAGLLVEATVA